MKKIVILDLIEIRFEQQRTLLTECKVTNEIEGNYVQIVYSIMVYFPEYTKNLCISTTNIQPNLKMGKYFESTVYHRKFTNCR